MNDGINCISKWSPQTRALWTERLSDIRVLDLDWWNTLAFSPARVHPRMLKRLQLPGTPLSHVCREGAVLAHTIVHDSPTDQLPDDFLTYCMEMNPLHHCACGGLQNLEEQANSGAISHEEKLGILTREFLRTAAAKFVGRELTDEDFADMEQVVRAELKWTHLFDDGEAFLLACRGKWSMNIISNMWYASEEYFRMKMFHDVPIRELFEHILTSFRENVKKPHPHMFQRSAQLTDISLEYHLLVEDSIPNILSGLNNGYRFAVLIHRDGELSDEQIEALPDNVLVVEDLMQLYDVLPEAPSRY